MKHSREERRSIGRRGEDIAAEILMRYGCEIIDRNVSFRVGEIDLVARQHTVTYFVEVKWRRSLRYGHVLEAITEQKLQRLRSAVLQYVYERGVPGRFSIVFMLIQGEGRDMRCDMMPLDA